MSLQERHLRSELAQLVSTQPLLRGTLVERRRRCGRSTCRCANDPAQAHPALYLFASDGQRRRQWYVPREWHQRVRQWVDNYRQVRQLTGQLSELYWQKTRQRQD
jgi:hypothetical protein